MKLLKPISLALALLAIASLFERKQLRAEERFTDSYAKKIQSFLHDKFAGSNAGMVIGLVDEHGSGVFGAGTLDNGTDQEVDGDTIFEIGSVTKVFTSLLALEMDRRGEMKLDDPAAKYLPAGIKVPTYEEKEIKLRNLAAQDSGLPWNPDDLEKVLNRDPTKPSLKEFKEACEAYTVEDLYSSLSRHKLTIAPGTRFQYSNVGMSLLGHAMARRAGESYESLVVSRIAQPLKMGSTRITLAPEKNARLARGHWVDGRPSENFKPLVQSSAGGLLSTANDLLEFLRANIALTQTELTPLMEEMQIVRHADSPQFGKTAMPWLDERMFQPPGSELWGHGGGGFGYLAFMGFDKKKRRGVVVLSNQMAVNPSGVGWVILQGMDLTRENVTYFVREIVGLGIALETDETTGAPRIMTVYPKSPAGEVGISVGLVIQKINGTSVEDKSLQECLGLMGGPVGTSVRLELLDPQRKDTRTAELTRRKFLTATYDSRN